MIAVSCDWCGRKIARDTKYIELRMASTYGYGTPVELTDLRGDYCSAACALAYLSANIPRQYVSQED